MTQGWEGTQPHRQDRGAGESPPAIPGDLGGAVKNEEQPAGEKRPAVECSGGWIHRTHMIHRTLPWRRFYVQLRRK